MTALPARPARPAPLFDEATRPTAPRIAGVTPAQRTRGRRLALYHAFHLEQMAEVRRALDAIAAGEAEPAAAARRIAGLDMVSNYRRFGRLCGTECQMLTFHHTAEDESMFPALRRASAALRPLIDRLEAEHTVIHDLLDRLEAGAVRLMAEPGPAAFADLAAVFGELERVVQSHFGYEETELEEALGVYGVGP